MNKIKILFATGTYAVGGKERQMTELIRNLPSDIYEIHLFVKKIDSYYYEKIKSRLASIMSLEKSHFSPLDFFRISQYIVDAKPDIVHSWATMTSHLCALAKITKAFDFSLINGAIRDAPIKLNSMMKIEKYLYKYYDIVVANSLAGLKAYGQQYVSNRYVIHNGYDMDRVPRITKQESRNLLNLDSDSFVVTMVACLAKRKDHKTFINAAVRCLNVDSNFKFVIVGDGEEKQELLQYVREKGDLASERILFLGERSDVENVFLASDISVLLSAKWHGEGIPNVVMESLACGIPVIASDNGGTREIVRDGYNGYIIECGDDVVLAEKILSIKSDTGLKSALKNNAILTITNEFTINQMVESYMQLYDLVG
jgi:glycosyltransferase involved in cell wall biosynthesis